MLILILSFMPNTLIIVAELVGVDYPPTLLFFIREHCSVIDVILQQSIQISNKNAERVD